MTKQQNTTPVVVLNRYHIHRNNHIVYKVLSSDGVTQYTCTLVNGKATGCDCASYKPCKHMRACEEKEAARTPAQAVEVTPVAAEPTHSTAAQRNQAPLNGNRAFSLLRR